MKRKIISILLTIIIITMTLPIMNISVKAKTLENYENDDWQSYWGENWIDVETEDVIEYANLDDYLNVHYKNYSNVDKSQITRLFIEAFEKIDIKDLSGLYDFTNLTELEIWEPVSQDAIKALDFTKLTKLKKLGLAGVNLSSIELDKLTNLTYLSITGSKVENFDTLVNLNNMKNLKHFDCCVYDIKTLDDVEEIRKKIIPLEGYEVYADYSYYDDELERFCMVFINGKIKY